MPHSYLILNQLQSCIWELGQNKTIRSWSYTVVIVLMADGNQTFVANGMCYYVYHI
jgi:hypothetical protein